MRCRLGAMKSKITGAPAVAIHGAGLRRKLLSRVTTVETLVDTPGTGKREVKAMRKADRNLATLIGMLGKLENKGKIDGGLAGDLTTLARGAKDQLVQLTERPQ